MKTLILIITCLLSFSIFAQGGKLKKADNFYEKLSFAYAANTYEQLLGSEVDSPEMKQKLAFSYLKIGENKKAIDAYAQMIDSPAATKDDYYNYAYALRQLGDYDESDKWMKKFSENAGDDARATLFLENPDYKTKIENIDPFFEMESIEINSDVSDFGGYLNPDENELYFITGRRKPAFIKTEWSWDGKDFLDIFHAPINEDGTFGKVQRVKKINTKFHEGPISFSIDGKTVYYTRDNIASGKQRRDGDRIQNLKIYISDVNEKGKWVNEREFPYNSKDYSVGHPTISKDGKIMYVTSDMTGGKGDADIYKVAINDDGSFGEMINLGDQINTEGKEMFPFIDHEGRLFFSSNGRPGLGGLDVYVAKLDKDGDVMQVMNLGTPINTRFDDFAFTLTNDLQKGYVSSNRNDGEGSDDIYSINSLRPIVFGMLLKGKSIDQDGQIVPLVKVNLKDENEQIIAQTTSDKDGKFTFDVDRNKDFELLGKKDNYADGDVKTDTRTDEDVVYVDLVLSNSISLYALVTDSKTGLPIEGATIHLIDKTANQEKTVSTSKAGEYTEELTSKAINDKGSYQLEIKKEGYFSTTVDYNFEFTHPGQYEIIEALVPEFKEAGEELVMINSILFDFDKYDIRPKAAKALDEIVSVMNKYPDMVIELGAHTDCRGSEAYNQALSDRRAKATRDYIKSRITNPKRIYGHGYGETKLLNSCACEGEVESTCSEKEHALNRRTEFKVISVGDANIKIENNSPDSF